MCPVYINMVFSVHPNCSHFFIHLSSMVDMGEILESHFFVVDKYILFPINILPTTKGQLKNTTSLESSLNLHRGRT